MERKVWEEEGRTCSTNDPGLDSNPGHRSRTVSIRYSLYPRSIRYSLYPRSIRYSLYPPVSHRGLAPQIHSLRKSISYVPAIHIHLLLSSGYYLLFAGDAVDTITGSEVESGLSHVCITKMGKHWAESDSEKFLLFPPEIVDAGIARLEIIGNKNPLSKTQETHKVG